MVLGGDVAGAQSRTGAVRRMRRCQIQPFDHYTSGGGTWVSMHACMYTYTHAWLLVQHVCMCMCGDTWYAYTYMCTWVHMHLLLHKLLSNACKANYHAGLMMFGVRYARLCCGILGALLLVCVVRCASICHHMVCNASDCISSWTLTCENSQRGCGPQTVTSSACMCLLQHGVGTGDCLACHPHQSAPDALVYAGF